jgi:hypothetical protein
VADFGTSSSTLASNETGSSSSSSLNANKRVDVALKIIPKKKVKGNESSVWGEMDVLKGLNHPNIVRLIVQIFILSSLIRSPRSSFSSGLNPGPSIISLSNWLLVANSLNES